AALCNEIEGILKTAKLPPSNITREEMEAIYNLRHNSEITILPVDKGGNTTRTTKYPTEAKKTILKQLQKAKKIDNHLIPPASIILRIHGTPKIHKPGAPQRCIIDSIGSVTCNLSKFIADLLKPLLVNTDYHCENAKQLAELGSTLNK
uniref:Reverse transcriptase domain-containing protein n=1 Tax=Oryzias latipes TaxID=8090 RepID=A0A3P9IMN0_ORYLA